MPNFFERSGWSKPIAVSDEVVSAYGEILDWNRILDHMERGQDFYKIRPPRSRNFALDYSEWYEFMEQHEVLTLPLFEEIISRNIYMVMPALREDVYFTYGELAEVLRRNPRVFETIRDDEHMHGSFFQNQLVSAREITQSHRHSYLWVLGEWISGGYNWWSESIPFLREALVSGLGFDEAIPYTSGGVHDVAAIQHAISNGIDPELMASIRKELVR